MLSAMRHRAAEVGDRLTYVRAETYAEVARQHEDLDGLVAQEDARGNRAP